MCGGAVGVSGEAFQSPVAQRESLYRAATRSAGTKWCDNNGRCWNCNFTGLSESYTWGTVQALSDLNLTL